ncbi:MAG: Crp/Fnr family transcriptional regulator [Oscillospiraceae bacterium]|nr:Crp/Fnr family transcriptional regulator [Oscillospiraceae bacterium]
MNTNADAIPSWNALGQIVLPQRSAEQFQRMGTPVTLAKNQTLYKVGDVPDSCYYVCQGCIVAFDCTPAGGEHIFSVNVPGELILVPSMVVIHPLVLNFKASEPTYLIRIHRETLFQEMADDAEFSAQLVYALSVRLIDTIEQSRERGSYSVPWRVCNLFLSMAGRYGVPYDGKVLIQKKMSQQAMANELHANRVTVARAIRELKDYGLVEYINGYYCVRDMARLKKHMDYLEVLPGTE